MIKKIGKNQDNNIHLSSNPSLKEISEIGSYLVKFYNVIEGDLFQSSNLVRDIEVSWNLGHRGEVGIRLKVGSIEEKVSQFLQFLVFFVLEYALG